MRQQCFIGSEETYRIWGFDPAQGVPSLEAVFQRIHPDDRDRLNAEVRRAVSEKRGYTTAYRIVLPDGTIKHLETIGRPEFSASGELVEIVTTQIDVTERKRAQHEHERLRQLESDLAHMNRLSMMGELTASLAHEIKQPIAAARNNARAALNFLDARPPDLDEVTEALDCIVGDADRAAQIIDRIRDHIKKAPPQKDRFDLNGAINEVIVLARGEITKNGVSVDTDLGGRGASCGGGSCSIATSHPEPDPECGRSNGINSGGATRADDQLRADRRQMASSSQCAILGLAFIRNMSSACSRPSTPRNPAA